MRRCKSNPELNIDPSFNYDPNPNALPEAFLRPVIGALTPTIGTGSRRVSCSSPLCTSRYWRLRRGASPGRTRLLASVHSSLLLSTVHNPRLGAGRNPDYAVDSQASLYHNPSLNAAVPLSQTLTLFATLFSSLRVGMARAHVILARCCP